MDFYCWMGKRTGYLKVGWYCRAEKSTKEFILGKLFRAAFAFFCLCQSRIGWNWERFKTGFNEMMQS